MVQIRFSKDPGIDTPKKAHPTDAGFDLPSAEDFVLDPGERRIVDTGIRLETPVGYFAMITPRSGWAAKYGITIVNAPGVIDSHYRGNIKIIMLNTGGLSVKFVKNDRIAQLIFMGHLADATLDDVETLDDTNRGTGGLGSTGR